MDGIINSYFELPLLSMKQFTLNYLLWNYKACDVFQR